MWYKLAVGRKCDLCIYIYIVQCVRFCPVVIKVSQYNREGQAVTSSSWWSPLVVFCFFKNSSPSWKTNWNKWGQNYWQQSFLKNLLTSNSNSSILILLLLSSINKSIICNHTAFDVAGSFTDIAVCETMTEKVFGKSVNSGIF